MIRMLMIGIACAAVMGCATNPHFKTELPSSKIVGEDVCEVPQHWKALALEGVDTRSLSRAVVVQVRIPSEKRHPAAAQKGSPKKCARGPISRVLSSPCGDVRPFL